MGPSTCGKSGKYRLLIMIFAVVTCSLWGGVFFALQKSLQKRLNGFGSGMGAIEMV